MAEAEAEAATIEEQLEEHLCEQRASLVAVDDALASDPSNPDLLEVREELLSAIKSGEEGLLQLKQSRLLKKIDSIFPKQGFGAGDDAELPQSHDDPQKFAIGSNCRFRHSDGRWYNGEVVAMEGSVDARVSFLTPTTEKMMMCKFFLQQRCRFGANCRLSHGLVLPITSLKNYTPTTWDLSFVGASILAATTSGIWMKAELESWDDKLSLAHVVFQHDGSTSALSSNSLSLSEFADSTDSDGDDDNSESNSSNLDDVDSEDDEDVGDTFHGGIGFLEVAKRQTGVQTETTVFAKWEQHTRGIASKMMASMGYREGMGLGISGQGMLLPVHIKPRPPKQALDGATLSSCEGSGPGRKRSRGGKRKREKKYAEMARMEREEERENDVFEFMNSQLARPGNGGGPKGEVVAGRKGPSEGEERRWVVACEEEMREVRREIGRLEDMARRNRGEKAVYEAAVRRLETARTKLASAAERHASARSAVANKDREKRMLKF